MEKYGNEILVLHVRFFNITELDLSGIATSRDNVRVKLRLSYAQEQFSNPLNLRVPNLEHSTTEISNNYFYY